MISLDESITLKGVKCQFTRSYHPRWKMKNDGCEQLSFTLDESSKVKNVNNHINACFSAVKNGWLCLLYGLFFYCSVWKQPTALFKWKDEHTQYVLVVTKYRMCFCDTNSDHHKSKVLVKIHYWKICRRVIFWNST